MPHLTSQSSTIDSRTITPCVQLCFNQHAGLSDDDVDMQIIGFQYMKQELKAGMVIIHSSLSSLTTRSRLFESLVLIELTLARKIFLSVTANVDWLYWAPYRQGR